MITSQLLLQNATSISNKYDSLRKNTGKNFNIFKITAIDCDELVICRIIHELLDPKGSHHQGTTYLNLFFEIVLKLSIDENELNSAKIFREYSLSDGRRIDLFIQTNQRTIPIEVKIYAGDQPSQCEDYCKKCVNSPLYYLTLDGSFPSPESNGNLPVKHDDFSGEIVHIENLDCISFSLHIINWLKKCLQHPKTIELAPIREIFQQLIQNIQTLTNQQEEDEEMEFRNLLSNEENWKALQDLKNQETSVKIKILHDFFNCLKEKFKNSGHSLCPVNNHSYSNDIANYYGNSKKCPRLTFVCPNFLNGYLNLYFYIEVNYRPYFGFYVKEKNELRSLTNIEWNEFGGTPEKQWHYLSNKNGDIPNFRDATSIGKFLNHEYLANFIEDSYQSMKIFVNHNKYSEKTGFRLE